MTTRELEKDWLSYRKWALWTVIPSTLLLLCAMLIIHLTVSIDQYKNQSAAIFGFFTLYFILVRGGHLMMIRSMHFDLKKTYGEAYEQKLAHMQVQKRPYNFGFALARIKRRLIDERESRRK